MNAKSSALWGALGFLLVDFHHVRAQAPSPAVTRPLSDQEIDRRVGQAGALFSYVTPIGGGTAGTLAAPMVERTFATAGRDVQSVNRLGQCDGNIQCLSAEFQRREAAMMNQGRERSLRPQRDASLDAIVGSTGQPWGAGLTQRIQQWSGVREKEIGSGLLDAVDFAKKSYESLTSRMRDLNIGNLVASRSTGSNPAVDERRRVGVPDSFRREQEERARQQREDAERRRQEERQRQMAAAQRAPQQENCRPYWDGGSFACDQPAEQPRESRPEGDADTWYVAGGYAVDMDGRRINLPVDQTCSTRFDPKSQDLSTFPVINGFRAYCALSPTNVESRRLALRASYCRPPERGPQSLQSINGAVNNLVAMGIVIDVVSDDEITLYIQQSWQNGQSMEMLNRFRRCN